LLLISIIAGIPEYASADGLPVGKHFQEPAHKNEVIGFYLNAVFTGIDLETKDGKQTVLPREQQKIGFGIIDCKISELRAEKRLSEEMTVDAY
jgi:hypothetical protein